jgi:hypothetical protein
MKKNEPTEANPQLQSNKIYIQSEYRNIENLNHFILLLNYDISNSLRLFSVN